MLEVSTAPEKVNNKNSQPMYIMLTKTHRSYSVPSHLNIEPSRKGVDGPDLSVDDDQS
jgi:hypothetical protein